jgi:hypothetical protein
MPKSKLHAIVRRDHDVSRFEVTVNNAATVRSRERIRDLHGIAERSVHIQAVPRNRLGKGPPGHVLHRDKGRAIVNIESVNRGDVWVVQRRGRLRFLLEAAQAPGVGGKLRRKNLNGDVAFQSHIARLVDDTHTAFPKLGDRSHSYPEVRRVGKPWAGDYICRARWSASGRIHSGPSL